MTNTPSLSTSHEPADLASTSPDQVAREFFARTIPDQIHLVAIKPDGPNQGRDFGADIDAAIGWARTWSDRSWNIYWTVNKVRPGVDKKPGKHDMAGARFAHLDVDPPKDGAPWNPDEALKAVKASPFPPTFIIWSGNGWQFFWRLADGSLEDAEQINKALLSRFDGDEGTWNHDRLMRVPGFVNYPNKKKCAVGRVPALAAHHENGSGIVYTASELLAALGVPSGVGVNAFASGAERGGVRSLLGTGPTRLHVAGDLVPLPDEYLVHLITNPKGVDRSSDVFACACEMARQGYDAETMAGVLLNPDNPVSEHCLAQGQPRRAAERAIALALDNYARPDDQSDAEAASERLQSATIYTVQQMLDRFVFIEDGSQVADIERPQTRLSFKDFSKATAASKLKVHVVDDKFRTASCARVWLASPKRLSVETVTFKAGAGPMVAAPDGRRAFNLWIPNPLVDAPTEWRDRCLPFVDHISWLWGEYAEQFFDWLAHLLQRPGELPHFGWLHVSKIHGKGRGWASGVMARILGRNAAISFDLLLALNSQFNDRLSQCLLAVVDEINEGGNSSYRHAQSLRQMVTAEHREINIKCGRKHVEFNAARWLVFSNHVGALPLEAGDRRFFVVDHQGSARDKVYYTRLYGLLDDPLFIASVGEFLRRRDISAFNPGQTPPMTKAKQALVEMSRTEAEVMLDEIVEKWPVDVITWSEIAGFMGDDTPKGSTVRHITDRAGMVKLSPRIRTAEHGGQATATYSLRNHQQWMSASVGALRGEIYRADWQTKQLAIVDEHVPLLDAPKM